MFIARAGSQLGEGANAPTHNSLLSDYYPFEARNNAFSFQRSALAFGALIGPLIAGPLAAAFGWRVPFIVFTIPTAIMVLLALRMREPVRGHYERAAMGASEDAIATEDVPPSFAESWRIVWNVGTLRRIFYALPFIATAFIGLDAIGSLYYAKVFHIGTADRGYLSAALAPAQLIGLLLGAPIATRLLKRGASLIPRFVAGVSLVVAAAWAGFALSPWLPLSIALNAILVAGAVLITPVVFVALSLTIPPKVRSFGYAAASIWILPGLVLYGIIGALADSIGLRAAILLNVPIFLIGAALIASSGREIDRDIRRVWSQAAAQSNVLYERRQGRVKMLLCQGVSVVLRQRAGALQRRLRGRRGRDRRAARHERRRQVDAAQGDRRHRRAERRRDRLRRSRHDLHAAERDRGPRRHDGPRRPGRVPRPDRAREPHPRRLAAPARQGARRRGHRARARAVPHPARAHGPGGRQPLRRPAADAHPRDGVHREAAPADDRRALARPRTVGRRPAARHRARAARRRHHDHPRRAVGERRAHRRRDRVLHGEGRDPLPRPHRRAARAARRAAVGVPRGRRDARSRATE